MFVEKNLNPFGAKISDCFIRSIAYVLGMSYYDALSDIVVTLAKLYSKDCVFLNTWMINTLENITFYLNSKGFVRFDVHGCCKSLAKLNTTGDKALLWVTDHLTSLDGKGNYIDAWDCGNKHSIYLFTNSNKVAKALDKYIISEEEYYIKISLEE